MAEGRGRSAPPDLPRLRRRIAAVYALAWLLGLGLLLSVAVVEGHGRRLEQLDTELSLRATVAYGLAWIDDEGRVHAELLEREPWAHDAEFPIHILANEPGTPLLWGPPLDPAVREALRQPAAAIAGGTAERFVGDVDTQRMYVLPMYAEQSTEVLGLAVVTSDLDALRGQQRRYLGWLLAATAMLAVAGLVVAWALARLSVQPLRRMLDDRTRFIAAAAHELRTPLSTLRAVAESGRAGDESPERALARVEAITRGAGHRVDTLLWYARLSAGQWDLRREPVRLDLLAEQVADDYPEARVEAEPTTAEVDSDLLAVVLTNLLTNAERHAGAEAGRGVVIRVDESSVTVEDEGPGFAGELDGRSEHPQGSGLGLQVVELIAELHGGTMQLGASPKGGARVRLYFARGYSRSASTSGMS